MKRTVCQLAAFSVVGIACVAVAIAAGPGGGQPGGGGFPGGEFPGGGGFPAMGGFPGMGGGAAVPAGIKAETNVPHVENGHRNQVLDVYYPEGAPEEPLPLMIWIHGGAWMAGTQANPPCLFLLSKGYAVASIQHRMSGDAKWPAQSYDCKAAVRLSIRRIRLS